MDDADRTDAAPSRLRTVFVAGATLVVAVHLVLVTLAALPPNAASTAARPASTYLSPFFSQNWRLFAPSPVSADHSVRFQGTYREDGELVSTDWVDWTDVELDLVRRELVGGRAGYVTNKMYSGLYTRFTALDDAQQDAVAQDEPDDPAMWADVRADVLAASVDDAGTARAADWLRYERAAVGLGSAVLAAREPDREWVSVRYAIRSQRVTPFAERHGTDAEREAARPTPFERVAGWRVPLAPDAATLEAVTSFDRRHR